MLDDAVDSIRARNDDAFARASLMDWLRRIWEHDFIPVSTRLQPEFGCPVQTFEEIEPYVGEFLGELHLFELNSSSFDDLDYTTTPNIKALAVGGNKLSRGLTLEGLMISYYLRRSTDYDTLLQMGRWFGYRHGFEDLTRVFTSHELADWFEDLATVEQELRDDIKRYEDECMTPMDMAVRIRAHRNMRVTSPRKMGAGRQVQGSFSNRLVQTIWFPLNDVNELRENIRATAEFINGRAWQQADPGWLCRDVRGSDVLAFLRRYRFVPQRPGGTGPLLDSAELLAYIERQLGNGELSFWNIGVKSQAPRPNAPPQQEDLGNVQVIPVSRSRLRGTEYKVSVISDPTDLTADLAPGVVHTSRTHPLLVIYPISKDSAPANPNNRTLGPLFENLRDRETVIGLVIDFPRSASEPFGYIAQQLP